MTCKYLNKIMFNFKHCRDMFKQGASEGINHLRVPMINNNRTEKETVRKFIIISDIQDALRLKHSSFLTHIRLRQSALSNTWFHPYLTTKVMTVLLCEVLLTWYQNLFPYQKIKRSSKSKMGRADLYKKVWNLCPELT